MLRWVSATLTSEAKNGDVSIRIVDEAEIRELNRTYRCKDSPTNVLSFAAELPAEIEPRLLGDLVLCAPIVVAEAAAQGKSVRAHWAHLVVHGTLHLLGMDHQSDDEAALMEAREVELLAGLGISDPYRSAQA